MLIQKLREATRPMHEELDTALVPYITNIRSQHDYTQLLLAFYGFFEPVYEDISRHLAAEALPDYHQRRKPADLLQNLYALHYTIEFHRFCRRLPLITDNASAFGALYVLEGSTLGGLMIKKMLAEKLPLSEGQLHFFGGYGKQTRAMWDNFVARLNAVAANEQQEETLVQTAAQTFVCFKQWLDEVLLAKAGAPATK